MIDHNPGGRVPEEQSCPRTRSPVCPSPRSPASSVSRCPPCDPGSSATASPQPTGDRVGTAGTRRRAAHAAPDARRDSPRAEGEPRCRCRAGRCSASTARRPSTSPAILEASERSDPVAVRAHLSEAHAALGLGPCLDDVLLPAMQQVGLWWQTGRCTVEDEHLTTEAARAWLETLNSSAPAPVRTTPIVLACGPTDLHTIGLEALCVLLRYERWGCRLLGARTSVPALAAALHATGAGAVVIVSHLGSGRARAVESLRAADRAGARSSTRATPSPRREAGVAFREGSWASGCRRPSSSSRSSSPEGSAFVLGQASEDAVVSPASSAHERHLPDVASSAHPLRVLDLSRRRSRTADREEQVGVLVQARRTITPVHRGPSSRARDAIGRPHCPRRRSELPREGPTRPGYPTSRSR